MSLQTTGIFSCSARTASTKVSVLLFLIAWVILSKYPSSKPDQAKGDSPVPLESTDPIQAILNWPCFTAISQVSVNNSCRFRVRTMAALMPLTIP